jgi:hypothetical protein
MRNGMLESERGTCYWYLNDKLHREDGPAIERATGTREWILNGERHREDGPACEYANGTRRWYLNNVKYTEEEHKIELQLRRCGLSTTVPYEWKSNA